jgi:hypothetical protein
MDTVFRTFLESQFEAGMALSKASDIVSLAPFGGAPPQRFKARFQCKGFVAGPIEPREAFEFEVGICFPEDYLRRVSPSAVLELLRPRDVWHPNVFGPFICVGRMPPGTPLVDLLWQVYEIISYNRVTMREDDALNPHACAWARHNQHRFPLEQRPLVRPMRNPPTARASEAPADGNGA